MVKQQRSNAVDAADFIFNVEVGRLECLDDFVKFWAVVDAENGVGCSYLLAFVRNSKPVNCRIPGLSTFVCSVIKFRKRRTVCGSRSCQESLGISAPSPLAVRYR